MTEFTGQLKQKSLSCHTVKYHFRIIKSILCFVIHPININTILIFFQFFYDASVNPKMP